MARVSDASRTGPEGGRSAPSPLGREGSEGGLSKLIRSAGGWEDPSVLLVSSNSISALSRPARRGSATSGVSKSYVSDGIARKSLESEASWAGVVGRGEGTSATRGAGSSAPWAVGALWITEGELVAVGALFLAVGLLSTVWSVGLLVLKAVRLLGPGSDLGGAVVARVEAVCAGVSESKATVFGCVGRCVTGGLGAGFFVSGVGEEEGDEVASGDTGGLALAFRAASLGECLRFGGIGVPAF